MNQTWQTFLQQQAAVIGDDGLPRFPDAAAHPECGLSDLSWLGLIRVEGEDARKFLQGQLTNDINQIDANRSQLSAYCNPKGRMFASFRIFQRGEALYLLLPRERLAAIQRRLQMFVLMSKVTLSDASDELAMIGIAGSCAEGLLPNTPPETDAVATEGDLTVIRYPGDTPRVLLIASPETLKPIWERAAAEAAIADADHWPLLDIRAGIPNLFDATAEAFVPQMVNLQLIDGVSFKKGCYTGQEVVARMQYLGQLKRRMYRAHVAGDKRPGPGSELFSPSSTSEQGAGKVVDARPAPGGGFDALVVTQISSAEANDLRIGNAEGASLELFDPPYSFEAKAE